MITSGSPFLTTEPGTTLIFQTFPGICAGTAMQPSGSASGASGADEA